MIFDSNTFSPTPEVMYQLPPCSRCRGPKETIRVMKDWGEDRPYRWKRYEVLCRCASSSCSWNNCVIHLSLNGPEDAIVDRHILFTDEPKTINIFTVPIKRVNIF